MNFLHWMLVAPDSFLKNVYDSRGEWNHTRNWSRVPFAAHFWQRIQIFKHHVQIIIKLGTISFWLCFAQKMHCQCSSMWIFINSPFVFRALKWILREYKIILSPQISELPYQIPPCTSGNNFHSSTVADFCTFCQLKMGVNLVIYMKTKYQTAWWKIPEYGWKRKKG